MGRSIPQGWTRAQVGQLGDVCAGRQRNPGAPGIPRPYLRVANVYDGRIDTADVLRMPFTDTEFERYRLRLDDVLLNEGQSIELVGRCAIYKGHPPDCAFQNSILRFQAGSTIAPDFAEQLFRHLQKSGVFAEIATKTTSIAHLGVSRLAGLEVVAPPIGEQRKIAAILTSVDETIEKTEAVIAQLEVVKKAMLEELLTRGIPGRHTDYKRSAFGLVPSGWTEAPFGEFVEQQSRFVRPDHNRMYREIGIRSHGKGVFHKDPASGSSIGNKRVFEVEPGCIAFNIVFAWEGAVAVTSELERGFIASHRFPMFRPDPRKADLQYLRLRFQSRAGTGLLRSISPGGAGRNRTINQTALRQIVVPLPPMEEQTLISRSILSSEAALIAAQGELSAMLRVKKGLSSDLLTGRVRVAGVGAS